jgi:hypothetical protein
MPYPVYHEVVDRMWKLLYDTSAYIAPYAPLPEDPTPEGIPFSVMSAHFPRDYFESATLNQVRRYLVLCARGERFCDGHIASQFESGSILAALKRLSFLRRELHPCDSLWALCADNAVISRMRGRRRATVRAALCAWLA